ncbi:MAG: hypothetical protein KatS3mg015_2339 [Fimbriimonadales bacterium]|nr:MAG: hypothetical protein KatS3mg015_2339 [Fimbriimonadales bacterium]
MDWIESVIRATEGAVDDLFRYARSMPEEWLKWHPGGKARTALSQLRECAGLPALLEIHVRERPVAPLARERVDEVWAEAKRCQTVEECEALCRANTAKLCQALRETDCSDPDAKVMLPWGKEFTLFELAYDHYWNLTYHLGQICFIQLLKGDDQYH